MSNKNNKTIQALRILLLLLMMVGNVGTVWADGYTRTLTDGLTVGGFVAKAFYNFQTNTPTVLPTSGGLRYRSGGRWGLHNYDAGPRSAIVSIPVEEGDLLVLQQYNDSYQTTINVGTKNNELSTSTTYQCFNITQDADEITISTPRYGGVVAVLVMSNYCKYTVVASDGTNTLGTVAVGTVAVGSSVTVGYPQYFLSGSTLYNIAPASGDWFRTTFTPDRYDYVHTLNYTNGTVGNVVFYTEGENIEGIKGATNTDRASNGRMGYTGSVDSWKTITRLSPGNYKIYVRGVNGNAATRSLKLHLGNYDIKTNSAGAFTIIPNGTDVKAESENLTVSESSDLSIACEGSSQSGLDWLYIVRTDFGWKPSAAGWYPADKEFTVSLTDVDYDNNINSSDFPVIINPSGGTVTYSCTLGSALPGTGTSSVYPPTRYAKTGNVTITATNEASNTDQFTLRVVAGTGNGTYDGGSRTFTFDQVGVLDSYYTVTDVPGITMTLGEGSEGSPTAIVVNDATVGPVLKAIDANGFSHPNLDWGRPYGHTDPVSPNTIPATGAAGGTYYVFRPTQMGNLHVVGNMSNACLYAYDSGTNTATPVVTGIYGTTLDAFLEKGKVYYLYNGKLAVDNATPLLHSFQYLALNEYEIDFSKMNFIANNNANTTRKALDRTLPGFYMEFEGGDNAKYENNDGKIHFRNESGGKLTLTPRLLDEDGTKVIVKAIKLGITDCTGKNTITFTDGTTKDFSATGDLLIPLAGRDDGEVSFTATSTTPNFYINAVTVYYQAEDNSNPDELLNKTKVAPTLTLTKDVVDVKNGDASTGTIDITVTTAEGTDSRYYAWAPGDAHDDNLSFTQTRSSVATLSLVNQDTGDDIGFGRGQHVPQLTYTAEGTGTTVAKITLAGNKYFAPAEASLTIINATDLAVGAEMEFTGVEAGQEIKIVAKSNGESSVAQLTLSSDASHTFSGTEETFYTYANANGTFKIRNDGPGTLTISDLNAYYRTCTVTFAYPKYDEAYPQAVTYVGRKLTPVLTVTDDETGEDVRDRFTYSFSRDETTYFGNISTELETLGQGIGLASSGDMTQTPTTVTVTLTTKGTNGYLSPATSFTSATTIDVLPAHQKWDFRTALAEQPALTGWSKSGTSYYSPNGTEFVAAVRTDNGKVLKEARGMEFHSSMRLYCGTGNDALRMFTGGSAVRIPVFEGQEVIIRANSHGTRTYSLSNATDIYGNDVAGFKCSGITELKFLAKADGYMQFTNNQNLECNILSINVQEQPLHFVEDAITVGTQYTEPISNPVLKGLLQEGNTATYAIVSGSEFLNDGVSALNTETGTITGGFKSDAGGKEVVISATAAGNKPSSGTYTIKIINLHFPDPAEVSLTLNDATGTATKKSNESGADAWKPVSAELAQLETDISYTCTTVSGNPNPTIKQDGSAPTVAFYTLECSGVGTVRVTAKSGYVEAHLLVTINGTAFNDAAPSIPDTQSEYTPDMTFGGSFNKSYFNYAITGKKGDSDLESATITVDSQGKLSGLAGHGVVQVTATGKGGTLAEGITRTYNLTRAYSASSRKDWRFYDIGHQYDSYTEKTKALTPIVDGEITGFNVDEYITDSKDHGWRLKYKASPSVPSTKGGKPRWAYTGRVSGDNGFIIEETAGLIFITSEEGFTVRSDADERTKDDSWKCYRHVGMRQYGSKMIVPKLKKGDYVEIKTIRHSDYSGEQIIATNLTDLNGIAIDPNKRFGLLGAQHAKYDKTNPTVDYPIPEENDVYGLSGSYTFIVANDGDVSFMLADAGNMDILQVRIYSGNYETTLQPIKEMSDNGGTNSYGPALGNVYTATPANTKISLEEGGDAVVVGYSHVNLINSTNTGPGKYVMVSEVASGTDGALWNDDGGGTHNWYKEVPAYDAENNIYKSDNGAITLESPTRWSSGGSPYMIGLLTATKQGDLSMRAHCYTKGWEYMTAYSPVLSVPVGINPTQTYPYTWDFTNIAAGTLADDPQNAKETIANDGNTNWASETADVSYSLKTDKMEGAYYVAGSQLVTKDMIIKETKGLGFDITTSPTDGSLTIAAPTNPASTDPADKKITFKGQLTIPDLYKRHYIYVTANNAPVVQVKDYEETPVINVSLSENTGDKKNGASYNVYRYELGDVSSAADDTRMQAILTFNSATDIYQIGVTDILKPMTQINDKAWATESRDVAIDHTLTGYFTRNDANAYTATATYAENKKKTTVALHAVAENYSLPAQTGIVMRLDGTLSGAEDGNKVPLFYPAITTPTATITENLLRPNVTEQTFTQERADADGTDNANGDYTRFILAKRNMTWVKEGDALPSTPTQFESKEAAVFYRLHIYNSTEYGNLVDNTVFSKAEETSEASLNTLGVNKAYLLLETDKINPALWNSATPSRQYIGIQGVSDMLEDAERPDEGNGAAFSTDRNRLFNLGGQAVDGDGTLRPGIYIRNGRKVVVR